MAEIVVSPAETEEPSPAEAEEPPAVAASSADADKPEAEKPAAAAAPVASMVGASGGSSDDALTYSCSDETVAPSLAEAAAVEGVDAASQAEEAHSQPEPKLQPQHEPPAADLSEPRDSPSKGKAHRRDASNGMSAVLGVS